MVYSESIDKLKAVLSAMHNMSHKRERLEKKVRFQLEREIRWLKKEEGRESVDEENMVERLAELQSKNATLDADVVKVCSSTYSGTFSKGSFEKEVTSQFRTFFWISFL